MNGRGLPVDKTPLKQGIDLPSRIGAVDINAISPNTFPVEIFDWDDPVSDATPKEIGLASGWNFAIRRNLIIEETATIITETNEVVWDGGTDTIYVHDATFGNEGIQLWYDSDASLSKLYVGDGVDAFLQYDGVKFTWKAANTELDGDGNLTASSATISGSITAATGEIGGWTIGATTLASSGTEIILDSSSLKITINSATFADTGIQLDYNGGAPRGFIGGTTKFFKFEDSEIYVTTPSITIDSSTERISVGTGDDLIVLDGDDATYRLWIGDATAADAPFSVEKDGTLYAIDGSIAGWTMTSSMLKSGTGASRIELNQGDGRIAVFATDIEKVVMGFLDALPAYDGTGTAESGGATTLIDTNKDWTTDKYAGLTLVITGGTGSGQSRTISGNTSDTITVGSAWDTNPDATSTYEIRYGPGDYGFWAREGNELFIDGDVDYKNGDWIIRHDASYLIKDGTDATVGRLGTYTAPSAGNVGLFFNEENIQDPDEDAPTGYRSYQTESDFFVGDDNSYLWYKSATSSISLKIDTLYIDSVSSNVLGTLKVSNDSDGDVTNLTNPVEITTENVAAPSWGKINHATEIRFAIADTTEVYINSDGVGIGGSPSSNLHIFGEHTDDIVRITSTTDGGTDSAMVLDNNYDRDVGLQFQNQGTKKWSLKNDAPTATAGDKLVIQDKDDISVLAIAQGGNVLFSGGYGAGGATISSSGNIQADGDLTVDGNAEIGTSIKVKEGTDGGLHIGVASSPDRSWFAPYITSGFDYSKEFGYNVTADCWYFETDVDIGGGYGGGGVTIYNTGAISAAASVISDTDVVSGYGSGGVALTINDGYGHANVTFNHRSGTPEQNGNAGRIEVNTDSSSGAFMSFELKSGVTDGTPVSATTVMALYEDEIDLCGGYGGGGVTISSAGNIQADGTLTVDGTSTLTGNVTAEGNITVDGALQIGGSAFSVNSNAFYMFSWTTSNTEDEVFDDLAAVLTESNGEKWSCMGQFGIQPITHIEYNSAGPNFAIYNVGGSMINGNFRSGYTSTNIAYDLTLFILTS